MCAYFTNLCAYFTKQRLAGFTSWQKIIDNLSQTHTHSLNIWKILQWLLPATLHLICSKYYSNKPFHKQPEMASFIASKHSNRLITVSQRGVRTRFDPNTSQRAYHIIQINPDKYLKRWLNSERKIERQTDMCRNVARQCWRSFCFL